MDFLIIERIEMKNALFIALFFVSFSIGSFASAQAFTGPQKNAVRSANAYLSMSGFSRDGLIEQLSSPYGDGYEKADATVAVDSLPVDWNEQAARSARQYLDIDRKSVV